MNPSLMKNLGDIALPLFSVFPQSSAAATINGASIDRVAHNLPLTCLLHTGIGAVSGAPSAVLVTTLLQHSPDNSTWTTFLYDGVHQAVAPGLSAASTDGSSSIDLTMAQRYIRAATTLSFTGGSSPTAIVATDIVIGGENMPPAI
jgi:hypothetical protein